MGDPSLGETADFSHVGMGSVDASGWTREKDKEQWGILPQGTARRSAVSIPYHRFIQPWVKVTVVSALVKGLMCRQG